MNMNINYDAGLYCRLSRDDNNGNSESMSIANQKQQLVEYVRDMGWNVKDIYIDDGYSGTTFERPNFQRMIQDIENGRINAVVTKDLSRLGRNYVLTGQYTDFFFPRYNVRYIAVNDNYDSKNINNDIAPFKNILNEMYAKDISNKIKSMRVMSAKQGKFMGSTPPYGYLKSPEDKHKLIVDEYAAKIVKRIFREYAGGDSARHIGEVLNHEKVLCPRDYYYSLMGQKSPYSNLNSLWGSSTVMQLLKNQVYLGHMVQGKRVNPSFKVKKRLTVKNQDEWITVENTHEPLIDSETWEIVQNRISGNKRNNVSKSGEVSLFSGIVRCADCGSKLVFNTKTYKSGNTYYKYKCSRYANNGRTACTSHYIEHDVLLNAVWEDIKVNAKLAAKDEEKLLNKLLSEYEREQMKETNNLKAKIIKADNRLVEIDNLIKSLFTEKSKGNVPDSIFKKMLIDYENEQNELNAVKMETERSLQDSGRSESSITQVVKFLKDCMNLETLDRDTLSRLIDTITVSEGYVVDGVKNYDITIQYRFVGNIA